MNGRQAHRIGTFVLSLVMVADRRGADRAGGRRARRRDLAAAAARRAVHRGGRGRLYWSRSGRGTRRGARRPVSRRAGRRRGGRGSRGRAGRRGARGALARDRAAQHRLADPVHDRLLVAGERDLLLARGDRRARARAHAARVPDRGAAVRADGDDLRRGRVAAPGARRLDGVRALRLQRARQLHRRLGDPARLRDPDRGHRLLGDAVPARLLEPARATAARRSALALAFIALVVLSNIRGFGGRRARRVGLLRGGDLRCRRSSSCSGSCCSSTRTRSLDPIHLGSAPTWSDLVFALTIAVISFTSLESAAGARRRGADQPRGPEAPGRRAAPRRSSFLYVGHRAGRGDGAAGARRAHGARRRAT